MVNESVSATGKSALMGGGGKARLKDFDILADRPLGHLHTMNARAFEVEQTLENGAALFALVCEIGLPLRTSHLDTLKGVRRDGLMALVDWGFAQWPSDQSRRLIFIYERPGDRLVPDLKAPPSFKEKEILRTICLPVLDGLQELHSRGIAHRNVRPDNLFYSADGTSVVMGDYLSVPPGMAQPAWVEPVEMAMAQPAGRGAGAAADDIYNLGATVLFLACQKNPVAHLDEYRLILNKINEGSYTALIEKTPITRAMEVGARSMLNDDIAVRAKLEDAKKWADTGRLLVKPESRQRTASRPFPFMGDQHLTVRSLGYAMTKDIDASAEIIANKSFDRWIRRSFGYEKMADDLLDAIGHGGLSKAASDSHKAIILARILLIIDPLAPIHYQGASLHLDGIGCMIAASLNDPDKLIALNEIIMKQLPTLYMETRKYPPRVPAGFMNNLVDFTKMGQRRGPAFGIERMMYEISPEVPCLSPLVKKRNILSTVDLITALDEMAGKANRASSPIDRHIIAFLAARHKGEIKSQELVPFGVGLDVAAQNIATARLLGKVQMFTDVGKLPNLTQWVADLLKPVIRNFKNIKRKATLESKLKDATESGSIMRVMMAADNETERMKDEQEFNAAVAEYENVSREIVTIERMQNNKQEIAQLKGEQVSVLIAMIIAVFVTFILISAEFS